MRGKAHSRRSECVDNCDEPSVAQLVEHVTVEFAEITGSLVRFRPEGKTFSCPKPKQNPRINVSELHLPHSKVGDA
jgi:hypothetical protein